MNRRTFLSISALASGAVLMPRGLRATSPDEQRIFRDIVQRIREESYNELPIGDAIVAIGRMFLDTPYVGGTLEINQKELCVINFEGLDCVTFFELSLDLARVAKKQTLTYDALQNEVTFTRYRGGKITDYSSRLHYTCDWFFDNGKKGVVRDMTAELGGVPYNKVIDFMSTHPDKYRQLRDDASLVSAIRATEQEIAKRTLHYIPKDHVAAIESTLHDGDIIGITTTIAGIDCSHTGLIVREQEHARFMHASSVKGKVIIADGSLSEYLKSVTKHTGIIVVRPL